MLLIPVFISNRVVCVSLEVRDKENFCDLELFKATLRYFLLL